MNILEALMGNWRYLAGGVAAVVAVAGVLWFANHLGYQRGKAQCEARWNAAVIAAERDAAELAARRQAVVDKGAAEGLKGIADVDAREREEKEMARGADLSDRECISAAGLRIIAGAESP